MKINSIYIVGLILAGVLFYLYSGMRSDSAFFYGFAENKETEISHEDNLLISRILVSDGQRVKKGDILLEATSMELDYKIGDLDLDRQVEEQDARIQLQNIDSEIVELETEYQSDKVKLENSCSVLKKKIQTDERLYSIVKNVDSPDQRSTSDKMRLEQLENELSQLNLEFSTRLKLLKKRKSLSYGPSELLKQKIDAESAFTREKQHMLQIKAPVDGIIGNVQCKEGENISGFRTLLNFYKHNPTQVKGYIHESMILQVKVGDKLMVSSSLREDHQIDGEVIGLGSRIVEIPERLRKIPEVKSYGREVIIRIPDDNTFLQKEKVLLNASMYGGSLGLANLFSGKKSSFSREEKQMKEKILGN